MGAKDSKPSYTTYEEALKRVTDSELKRLKDAFKRSSTLSGYMTKPIFIREVLGDGVPPRLAEQMYVAFGGTAKGLAFKDLLCGLVLVTRGRPEEKVRFLFGLYANDALTHVQKEDMDQLVLATEGHVPDALSDLFRDTDRVTYESFRTWLLAHAEVTSVTQWLLREPTSVTLYNNLETPTFYQTLAGVTHLEETDIIELEKRYWTLKAQSKTGRFDLETFRPVVCPPLPDVLCEGVFNAFDENRDNHIDFKEMACGISACCRGPMMERQKFCFKIFDVDHDSLLSRKELEAMLVAMLTVRADTHVSEEQDDGIANVDPSKLAEEIIAKHDTLKEGKLSQEDFLVWTVNQALPNIFLQLLFQVCHVVLGLKPQSKEDEAKVISGWLEREERRGLIPGTTWYLVSMPWWKQWLEYVNLKPVQIDMAEEIMPVDGATVAAAGRGDPGRRPTTKAGSICRSFGRRSSMGLDESDGVVGTSYVSSYSPVNGLDASSNSASSSPLKTASGSVAAQAAAAAGIVPASSLSSSCASLSSTSSEVVTVNAVRTSGTPVTASPQNSPTHRAVLNVPSETGLTISRNGGPSPCPSPKLSKKVLAALVQRPGAIDNTQLIHTNTSKVMTLTNEGGRLKRDKMLARGRDFELLPEPVWRALSGWYGGSPALPRTVITSSHGDHVPELELYPITVRLLRHQSATQRPTQVASFTGMIGGMGGMAVSTAGLTQSQPPTPRRYLAYLAAFSRKHTLRQVYEFLSTRLRITRDDMRLWKLRDEHNMILLEDEDFTMEQLGIDENQQLLIEVRNKDLTWPEEMSQLAKNKAAIDKKQEVATEPGATGLNNLGNTCFMNSALQCVSNTGILTRYFREDMHLYELNRNNPLGMKGHIAQRYGELVKDLWRGNVKSIAPLKLRWTIGKYAPRFNGFQQHDSQELLAFLLDGLHEDLNRVHDKPYVELKDSDGRPDDVVATEAWDNHLLRNRSVVVDLFHGQLKSCVRCLECGHTSVRFDPFTYLSLPLPMDSCIHIEIIVLRLNGSVPIKYGIRLSMDEKYNTLKKYLSELCGISVSQLLLVEISGALVKSLPQDLAKIRSQVGGSLYAYEMPLRPDLGSSADESLAGPADPATQSNGHVANTQELTPKWQQTDLKQIQRRHLQSNVPSTHQTPSPEPPTAYQQDQLPTVNRPNGGLASSSLEPPLERQSNGQQPTSNGNGSSSINNNYSSNNNNGNLDNFQGFVIAVHRKMIRMDVYFLSSQKSRPSLFGTPLLLPCDDTTTTQDMYSKVWTQVSRLVSPLPPSEAVTPNHAQDCDDSMGYEYPFALKVVQKDGFTCAWCPWYRFCRGCKLECNGDLYNSRSCYIAVDWEPTALHLRYQTSQERMYAEHMSVQESRRQQTEPIDLDTCLKAFTKEEQLGEDELYYCSKCKEHRLAAKKLEIWRLPPILIIHLKRFQFVNGRWVKSQKIVKFPINDFDPTAYIVPRRPASATSSPAIMKKISPATNTTAAAGDTAGHTKADGDKLLVAGVMNGCATLVKDQPCPGGDAPRETGPDPATTGHTHQLNKPDVRVNMAIPHTDEDYDNVRYDLYALSSHMGILGGGHYVSYTKNHQNTRWYCYNDSSCKEISNIDTDSAYILFYERHKLERAHFMPDVTGKERDTMEIEDEFESDFKKMCVVQ